MANDISDPEERAGYKTITFPYTGNDGMIKAMMEWIGTCKDHGDETTTGEGFPITILRVFQEWHGTTIVYRKGTGKP